MSFKLERPPAYRHGLLPRFPGYWIALGPGIVWMAMAQGSGELIWWPYFVAKYGLALIALLIPACLLQYPFTYEIGRYTVLSGESIWKGFVRLSPGFAFVLWLLFVVAFLWLGAFASAGGTAIAELTRFPFGWERRSQCLFWGVSCVLVFAGALLTRKHTYQFIEKVMWFVALASFFGLAVSCTNPDVVKVIPEFFRGLFRLPAQLPSGWERGDADKLITALTYAGMGGFWSLFYSYWVLGKGTGMAEVSGGRGTVAEPDDQELLLLPTGGLVREEVVSQAR